MEGGPSAHPLFFIREKVYLAWNGCEIQTNRRAGTRSASYERLCHPAALAFAINLTLCLIVFYDNPRGGEPGLHLLILSFVGWNAAS